MNTSVNSSVYRPKKQRNIIKIKKKLNFQAKAHFELCAFYFYIYDDDIIVVLRLTNR